MFGYVLPSRDRLDERERERFRAVYCGLCHTLRERYGFAASLLLNYDFTLLAILLSSGDEESCTVRRCAVHPCKGCRAQTSTPALEAAADRTVILSWWQLRDHIADHGFWSGLKYRFASLFLRGAYRRAGERLPRFDAADDLKKDTESGNYNPLLYRYHTENGVLGDADRLALAETLDASIERMASAYALYDYGVWTPILDSIFYESLYGIGKAVLDGTYRRRTRTRYGERKKKSNEEAL